MFLVCCQRWQDSVSIFFYEIAKNMHSIHEGGNSSKPFTRWQNQFLSEVALCSLKRSLHVDLILLQYFALISLTFCTHCKLFKKFSRELSSEVKKIYRRKVHETNRKRVNKMLFEAADSKTKKIVSELSNYSFSKPERRVSCSNQIRGDAIRIRSGRNSLLLDLLK